MKNMRRPLRSLENLGLARQRLDAVRQTVAAAERNLADEVKKAALDREPSPALMAAMDALEAARKAERAADFSVRMAAVNTLE